jgi:hypothetical protein
MPKSKNNRRTKRNRKGGSKQRKYRNKTVKGGEETVNKLPLDRMEIILNNSDADAGRKKNIEKFLKALKFPKDFNRWERITDLRTAANNSTNGHELAEKMQST